jgi:hypothetical protein
MRLVPTAVASLPLLTLVACGAVSTGTDATPGDIDAPSTSIDASTVDAPTDACVPSLRLSAQFMVSRIVGSGASSLDQLLNHPNGLIVSFANFNVVRGIDNGPVGSALTTAVTSTAWTADFTGQDGDFLDTEVGQHLNRGLVYMNGVFQLSEDRVYFYVLPTDEQMHPYMAINCYGQTLPQDGNGFPTLQTATYTGCTTTFYDFRPPTQKNVLAESNTTFEVSYLTCP